jgi:dynactin complex subunit
VLEYTLLEDNLDEINLRFKEIIVYRDYKNNLEIRFISINRENEKNTLSEIVVSAYSVERENYELIGVNYRGNKDLTRILTVDVLQGNPLSKELPVSENVEVSKRGNKEKGCNSIRFAQKDRAMRLYSKGVKIRNYCTTRPSDEKLVELEINALTDIFNFDTRYLDIFAIILRRG